ncbi:RNA cap guanine-N2 methyltransferase-domain-containing protein [Cantharellus anzutake]|uniref:RNA cap guanine-N2 methyltransferase-domain-containing protein n=1 Tax=Cantharellus anzutake TaxID=1750568 RepID=UPI0019054331|nr:RNA cap guanine-N2 methyltransferase-domain-containing protein [Cantharellus anzutake]KAF8334209.1 RNA cap guanine-N2 methyltransferase-domain-containing protein [Cantharellus anzutake]
MSGPYAGYSQDRRPQKKRKVEVPHALLGPGWERYDATGLAPHYTHAGQVPHHIRKYFAQRQRYFSLYNEGCLLDEEGWYSVTPERMSMYDHSRCFCGVGGNAIAFAQTCERVIAVDNSAVRLALARHNAVIYGVQDRIEFILADFPSFVRSLQVAPATEKVSGGQPDRPRNRLSTQIDVAFLSPPWGGPSYISSPSKSQSASSPPHPEFTMDMTAPLPGDQLFSLARSITPHVAYYLPRNTNLEEIAGLVDPKEEKVEIEEEWMGSKLKALTFYFGGLVNGQEHLWID